MSLTIFNGSPRGKSSNSEMISNWFSEGHGGLASKHYLNRSENIPDNVNTFLESDTVLMVFPLYVDGMPGQIKAFFEALLPHKSKLRDKKITFIIHSGFTEGIQNRALETYLIRLAEIFSLDHRGVIIIPGSEGFRLMPPAMTKKKRHGVMALGAAFKQNQAYPPSLLKVLNPKETMSKKDQWLFMLFSKLGLTNMYWNSNLKKHNAFEERYAAPYKSGPVEVTCSGYTKNY